MAKNFDLEIQKLLLEKQKIELSRSTLKLRIAEMDEEKNRIAENFPLYDNNIKDFDKQISDLQEAKDAQNKAQTQD